MRILYCSSLSPERTIILLWKERNASEASSLKYFLISIPAPTGTRFYQFIPIRSHA